MGRFVNPIPQICLPPIIAKAVILRLFLLIWKLVRVLILKSI